MALITRITRLFKADFHAVLDSIEEPELMLRQAIREMEEDLGARERGMRLAAQEQERLRARKEELARSRAEVEEQLDLCFASQKTGLARGLVRRKLEGERLAKHLDRREAELGEQLAEERARLEEHRLTLDGLRQKAEVLARRPPESREGRPFGDALAEAPVTEDEVEVALLREQAARKPS